MSNYFVVHKKNSLLADLFSTSYDNDFKDKFYFYAPYLKNKHIFDKRL